MRLLAICQAALQHFSRGYRFQIFVGSRVVYCFLSAIRPQTNKNYLVIIITGDPPV